MAVSKVKMMELSELRSYSFLGSMHIVFHLQFNLPSSSFLLPMSVFDATVQLNGGGRNPEPYQCAACENKIKSNLRFEKGIKSIETSVPDQTVTVQYNADKTTPEKLQKGFEKFGYKARILKDGEKVEKNTGEKCDLM